MTQMKFSSTEKYDMIFTSFVERFRRERELPRDFPIDWEEFSRWIIRHAESKKYSLSYRRIIRAAVLFALSTLETKQEDKGIRTFEGIKTIKNWDPVEEETEEDEYDIDEINANRETLPKRNIRTKARMIPKEDWSALINYFNTRPSLSNIRAQAMLAAGVGCGARPIEWINAHLIDHNVIRIYTAKVKNINAWNRVKPMVFTEAEYEDPEELLKYVKKAEVENDLIEDAIFESRIKQSGLDPEKDKELIQQLRLHRKGPNNGIFRDVMFEEEFKVPIQLNLKHIDDFFRAKFGDNWRDMDQNTLEKVYLKEYYNNVRISVWRACKKLFGDRIYSPADTRSTFSANRKAKYGIKQTSIDMGHTSTTMTKTHYAPAKKAWK